VIRPARCDLGALVQRVEISRDEVRISHHVTARGQGAGVDPFSERLVASLLQELARGVGEEYRSQSETGVLVP
jgi:hypothetical protein